MTLIMPICMNARKLIKQGSAPESDMAGDGYCGW